MWKSFDCLFICRQHNEKGALSFPSRKQSATLNIKGSVFISMWSFLWCFSHRLGLYHNLSSIQNTNSLWEYKPLCECLEKGTHLIVYLNNHFPWNENRSILGHWYLLSYWGTSLSPDWVRGLCLAVGAVMVLPFSVDSELEVSKLNSDLLSLRTSRTPLMTSSPWHS